MLEFEDHIRACHFCVFHCTTGLRHPHLRFTGRRAGEQVTERTRTALSASVKVPVHLAAARTLLDILASLAHRRRKCKHRYKVTQNLRWVDQTLRKLNVTISEYV